jgi:hypothetical protein
MGGKRIFLMVNVEKVSFCFGEKVFACESVSHVFWGEMLGFVHEASAVRTCNQFEHLVFVCVLRAGRYRAGRLWHVSLAGEAVRSWFNAALKRIRTRIAFRTAHTSHPRPRSCRHRPNPDPPPAHTCACARAQTPRFHPRAAVHGALHRVAAAAGV